MNHGVERVGDGSGPAGGWVSSRPRAERARRVADVLRQQIGEGGFGGGRLPDERALGRQLGASRNAVREALGLLRREGLITRRRGVGTTVVMPKYGQGLDRLAGLAEALAGHGTVTNQVRVAEEVAVLPDAVAARLEVPAEAGGVRLERVRWLNGLPLSLDTSYLPADVGAAVLAGDLVGRDVFGLIEEATGCRLGRADVVVHAVCADPDTAALLGIPAGAAVFALERLTRLTDGRAVDTESIHVRADRMTLRATLQRGLPPAAT
ncbi:GntR family transcriptional regulator [Streptomyces sp. NBC_01754]|uniref:GntR family transcriptional regulator n=1 Tax=Streptomyces sp. NBC_01754 TaxID=2975930 RepID=UPI002DDACCD7|nr:GntR family transcriptional regulator [Streptomyces sp. NBC_01754]WSC95641.1 GntR family transcriptional regulator [Streptomyces sp. NBC_01754]